MARRASKWKGKLGASGICAPRRRGRRVAQSVRISGASHTFIVHRARRADRVARRAGAKSI
ncbi:hypothetical protein A2U01_0116149 [Trifolium medium]|uniref:Uncharacterized protein n=1 Tax=Trifolium medium TaxID=97028 RepID=A0A392W6T0_9FABA|nr:hypothetical protein [Trifolium medium]